MESKETQKTQILINMRTIKDVVNECFANGLTVTFKSNAGGVQVIVGHAGKSKAALGNFPANIMNQPDDVFESVLDTTHAKLVASVEGIAIHDLKKAQGAKKKEIAQKNFDESLQKKEEPEALLGNPTRRSKIKKGKVGADEESE
jgi:hypothetical protein